MPKQPATNYLDELRLQRSAWESKPSLRSVYHHWFATIVRQLQHDLERPDFVLQPVVELGSGCGSFQEYYPESIGTDVVDCGPWIKQIVDARSMPWEDNSIGNMVMIDCPHHLPRPIRFLRSVERVLKPGGRLLLWEPAATPFACWFWKRFHHEPVDLSYDFAKDESEVLAKGEGEPANPGFMYANMGTAHRLFASHRNDTFSLVPNLSIPFLKWSDFLAYPLTGGFSYRTYAPGWMIHWVQRLESKLLLSSLSRQVGLRMLIVLEKGRTA